jgi:hypothetical protein
VLGLGPGTREDAKGLDRAAAHVISLLAKEKAKAGDEHLWPQKLICVF